MGSDSQQRHDLNPDQKTTPKTDFADVHILGNGIIECIPYENIQLTESDIDELDKLMSDNGLLLFNLDNHFSINFEGILRARNMQHVRVIALVSERDSMKSFPATLFGKEQHSRYPYRIFSTREKAIEWLQKQ